MKTSPGNLLAKDSGNTDKLFSATLTRVSYCIEESCRPHYTPWAGLCQCTALFRENGQKKRERLPVAKWKMRHRREKGENEGTQKTQKAISGNNGSMKHA